MAAKVGLILIGFIIIKEDFVKVLLIDFQLNKKTYRPFFESLKSF